jgi:two-component system chemotaxis response regulator CheY
MGGVLIVEDNLELLNLYRRIISVKCGLKVTGVVTRGDEAVEAYVKAASKPDLVIMDINVPGIDGITAAAMIKRIDPDARILLATAEEVCHADMPPELMRCPIIHKPFSMSDFVESIKSAMVKTELTRPMMVKVNG